MEHQHGPQWWTEAAKKLFESQGDFHDLDFDPEYWPRDPSEYTPTTHFMNKKKDPQRCIEGRHIRGCIEEGEIFPSYDTKALFAKEFDGVKYYLTVGGPQNGRNFFEAVTMYPWVINKCKALRSGMWTEKQIKGIRKLNEKQLQKDRSKDILFGFGLSGVGQGGEVYAD